MSEEKRKIQDLRIEQAKDYINSFHPPFLNAIDKYDGQDLINCLDVLKEEIDGYKRFLENNLLNKE